LWNAWNPLRFQYDRVPENNEKFDQHSMLPLHAYTWRLPGLFLFCPLQLSEKKTNSFSCIVSFDIPPDAAGNIVCTTFGNSLMPHHVTVAML